MLVLVLLVLLVLVLLVLVLPVLLMLLVLLGMSGSQWIGCSKGLWVSKPARSCKPFSTTALTSVSSWSRQLTSPSILPMGVDELTFIAQRLERFLSWTRRSYSGTLGKEPDIGDEPELFWAIPNSGSPFQQAS